MYQGRRKFVELLKEAKALVLVGETGSGKTTQAPRFALEAGLAPGHLRVACTQPRRVAATSVARRVAEEMSCRVGERVGYRVRFEDATGPGTRLVYMTDGMLLREAILDPSLSAYGTILLDEVHERSLSTDVLLGVVKKAALLRNGGGESGGGEGGGGEGKGRGGDEGGEKGGPASPSPPPPPLHVVAMSATLDADRLLAYFPGSRACYVEGRTYPVSVRYTLSAQASYLDALVSCCLQVAADGGDEPGDILAFLTGQDEIEAAARLIVSREPRGDAGAAGHERRGGDAPAALRCLPVPLYASLPPEAQRKAFEAAPAGFRKVVLATNVAETSLTVPGVTHVVDSGVVKSRAYSPRSGADCLAVVPISRAAARQRAGRAGRLGPGTCWRLYTEEAYFGLAASTTPEILRTDLAGACLQLLSMGVVDILRFDFLDPPPRGAVVRAMQLLLALGALDERGRLTPKGRRLARLPVDPRLGASLLAAEDLGCVDEVIDAVAVSTTDGLFVAPRDSRDEARTAHARWRSPQGDAVANVATLRAWLAAGGAPGPRGGSREAAAWASDRFLSLRALRRAADVAQQLRGHLQAADAREGGRVGGGSAAMRRERARAVAEGRSAAEDTGAAAGGGDDGLRTTRRSGEEGTAAAAALPSSSWPFASDPSEEAAATAPMRKALASGLFLHAARRGSEGRAYRVLASGLDVLIHPGSCLGGPAAGTQPACIVFSELVTTNKAYAREVTAVDPTWLPEIAPAMFVRSDGVGQRAAPAS